MVKAKGLGRGLDALLLSGEEDVQKNEGSLQTLLISELQPGKYQPRSIMQEEALHALSQSILKQGVMQPIIVRPVGNNQYEIIAGERRWRAASGCRPSPRRPRGSSGCGPDRSAHRCRCRCVRWMCRWPSCC